MKVEKTLSILLLVVSLVFISCSGESHVATGRLMLSFQEDEIAKTLTPIEDDYNLLEVTKYDYILESPSGKQIKGENLSKNVTFNDMVIGDYSIVVYGKNSAGTVVAEGSKNFSVKKGENSVTVELVSLRGNGTLNVNFVWDPNRAGEVAYDAKLKNMKTGDEIILTDSQYNYLDGMVAFYQENIPAGSYILTLKLMDGSTTVAGHVEAVRIGAGVETTTTENYIEIPIGSEVKIMQVTVKDMTGLPIVGTISVSVGNIKANGMPERVTLSYTIRDWNGNETLENTQIDVTWYADSAEIGEGNNITYTPQKDSETITAVFYQTEFEGSIGSISKTIEYDVLPSAEGFSAYTP